MSMDAPEKDDQDQDSSMTDEEARRILAEMDAPFIPENSEIAATQQDSAIDNSELVIHTETVNTSVQVDGSTSNENEYLSTDDEGSHRSSAHQTQSSGQSSGPFGAETSDDIGEIPEFSPNEFATDPEMLADFRQNSGELMEALDQNILSLEQNPSNKETIEAIFRAAHTLKGTAGMFGFLSIERVMHRLENLFDYVRKGKLVPSPEIIDLVFRGLDTIRGLIGAAVAGAPSGIKTAPLVKSLDMALKNQSQIPEIKSTFVDPKQPESSPTKSDQTTIRVDLDRLDMLVNLVGELVIDRTRFSNIESEIRTAAPHLKAATHLSEAVQTFSRHMTEIHEIIMKVRMVPIGHTFSKFTRLVRDLGRQLGKEIRIDIKGEDTELDKTLVEQIGDPLIHLIRNACDHGIESPENRLKAGKDKTGKVEISAKQEGHHVIITIKDDGKGIPLEAVKRKGIERGLIKDSDVLSDRDIFNLIFEPGFSTAEKVTNLSGRGVGMDVVRKQIGKLKGIIEIDSEAGKGTKISIRLPLTLAIVQSLLVKSRKSIFALPLSSVIESLRIKSDEIQRIGTSEVIKRHERVLPLLHLDEVLQLQNKEQSQWYQIPFEDQAIAEKNPHQIDSKGLSISKSRIVHPKKPTANLDKLFVVIVGTGEKRLGIVVDQLLHQQEMVIKSLGSILTHIPCIAGGSVLGNGEVALVIDIPELEERFRTQHINPHQVSA
jgi:two-component system chemotaxis sensor kinase CheA